MPRRLDKKHRHHDGDFMFVRTGASIQSCTVDPILFENFATDDGDRLRALFRAFKFPESNFVLFKGTVNVCLDRCGGIECSNGQIGFGRRRRDVTETQADRNRIYEVSMSTVVKVAFEPVDEEKPQLWVEKATMADYYHPDEIAIAALSEEFGAYKYVDFQGDDDASAANALTASSALLLLPLLVAAAVLRH